MTFMDLSSQRLVSGICSAGFVIFCESEYACFKLFKRRTTLFFFVCQLTIWSTALETALAILLYFMPNLQVPSILVIFLITKGIRDVSHPVMILLRLKMICYFHPIMIYISIVLSVILNVLNVFWICWVATGESYYFNVFLIVEPIIIIIYAIQFIVINISFIVIGIKHFQNIIHIRFIVIVNIIITALICTIVLTRFLHINKMISFCVMSIISQIIVRLDIEILSCIAESVRERERRVSDDESETERNNKFCYFFLWRSRTAGLT
jgi:hypothetical protein